ncbi:MAG: pseudouridine synthase [bacterium]|nr:pseudouridine synthase [bacterium]
MSERLQKVIASAGIASRRAAERMIRAGEVTVNGELVTEMGTKVDLDRDHVEIGGRPVRPNRHRARLVYALYKPRSVVTTLHDPEGRDTIVQYFPRVKERLFPVGRLDYDAEGLLLLTNDGELANQLMHPSKHVWKEYLVKLKGRIPLGLLKQLESGPVIDGRKRQPVKIRFLHYKNEKTWLSVSLQEGLKHHLKKMFFEVGFSVEKIKRYSVGNVELQDMRPGQCRLLETDEIKQLLELSSPS